MFCAWHANVLFQPAVDFFLDLEKSLLLTGPSFGRNDNWSNTGMLMFYEIYMMTGVKSGISESSFDVTYFSFMVTCLSIGRYVVFNGSLLKYELMDGLFCEVHDIVSIFFKSRYNHLLYLRNCKGWGFYALLLTVQFKKSSWLKNTTFSLVETVRSYSN